MFCTKCGKQFNEGEMFCTNCGASYDDNSSKTVSVNDSTNMSEYSDFDKNDGFDYSFDDDSVPTGDYDGFDNSEVSAADGEGFDNSYSMNNYSNDTYGSNYSQDDSYSQNYNSSQDDGYNQEDGYSQNYNYNQDDSYNQNYDNSQDGGYSQNYNYGQDDSYNQNYDNSQDGGYSQDYNYSQNGSYNQNYNGNQEDNYSQNYDNNQGGGYSQNYEYNQENNSQDDQYSSVSNQGYDISYDDSATANQDDISADSDRSAPKSYEGYENVASVVVGNKKYISMDSVPASQNAENAGASPEAVAVKPKNKVNKTAIIVSAVIAGIILLIAILVSVLVFTDLGEDIRDTLFGSSEVEEDIIEPPVQEPPVEEEKQEVEETPEEPEEEEEEVEEEEDEEEPEIMFGEFPISVSIPAYMELIESSDTMLQLASGSDSAHSMTIVAYPDYTVLTEELCNDLVENMIGITETSSVAILVCNGDSNYSDAASMIAPFIEDNYGDEEDYILLAEYKAEEYGYEHEFAAGGIMEGFLESNRGRIENDMKFFGSDTRGFLYSLQDSLYELGYQVPGYNEDHSLYKVIVNEGPLKLRANASSSSEIVNLLDRGDLLSVYKESEDGEWYYVYRKEEAESGWVKAEYCDDEEDDEYSFFDEDEDDDYEDDEYEDYEDESFEDE